jgi:hypothetical protein
MLFGTTLMARLESLSGALPMYVRYTSQAAKTFNEIWRTGDPSSAKDIMADDVVIVSICMQSCKLSLLQSVGTEHHQ